MNGVNKVILVGTLTRDPETTYTGSGMAVCKLSVVTNKKYKSRQTNEMVEEAEFHRCTLFGKVGEIAQEYLHKGSQCYLEGELKTNKWQDKDGNDRYTTEVICNQLQMLGGKRDAEQPKDHVPPETGNSSAGGKTDEFFDDASSIPF